MLLLFAVESSQAQEATASYKVKAVFIYNFTQFVDWPMTSFDSPDSPFVIGILGDNPFGSYIDQTVSGEKVGTHPIIIKHYNTEREVDHCHLLYISFSSESRIKESLDAISNKNILTIGEGNNFSRLGGIIRFYTDDNKIRLQINTEAARTAQLNISSKLLSLAKTN